MGSPRRDPPSCEAPREPTIYPNYLNCKILDKQVVYSIFFNKIFFNNLLSAKNCLEICFNNLSIDAVQPNHEKPGGPNSPTSLKLLLGSFECGLLNKHVEHFDRQVGAGHSLLGGKDVKIMKDCTIILIGCIDRVRLNHQTLKTS